MTLTSGQIENLRRAKANEIKIEDPGICYHCKSTGLKEEDYFCPNCRFPQRGTQQEMKIYLNRVRIKKSKLKDQQSSVRKARNTLFILSALIFVVGLIYGLAVDDNSILISNVILAGIYLGLGFWSKQKPFAAILIGLFLYLTMITINAIIEPFSLIEGIFLKVVFIVMFVYGIKGAKEAENMEKELAELNKPVDYTESNDMP